MKQELIWELMKQAGELAYEEHKAKCLEEGLDPERTVWSVTGATYEKFAELIVRECGNWVNNRLVVNPDYGLEHRVERNRAVIGVMKEFNQHFGVEE
jgi:hypothetical protein